MADAKHTPGPWSLKSTQSYATEEYDTHLHPIGIFIPEQVSQADADLIATAPELLEALQNLRAQAVRYLPDYNEHPEIQAADEVVAKATGSAS